MQQFLRDWLKGKGYKLDGGAEEGKIRRKDSTRAHLSHVNKKKRQSRINAAINQRAARQAEQRAARLLPGNASESSADEDERENSRRKALDWNASDAQAPQE